MLSELADTVDGLVQQASVLPELSDWERVAPGMGCAPMSPQGFRQILRAAHR